jgi:hypothetical protein
MSKKKIILKISIVLAIIFIVFGLYSIDKLRCLNNKKPLFTFYTIYYKDGGTQYKVGIGYSVILWNKLAGISLNNTEISGFNKGMEFIKFPLCYLNIFNHNIKPSIQLQFFPNDYFKELYEASINQYFNIKIIRNENHGLMNIIPCDIFIYNENMELIDNKKNNIFNIVGNHTKIDRMENEYLKLYGGEVAFFTLPDGKYSIKIITPKEEQMNYFEEYNNDLESIIYDFEIAQNQYKEIKIIPEYDFKDIGIWTIE